MRNRRFKNILLIVVLGFLTLTVFYAFLTYHHTINQAQQTTLTRLMGISNALALQIDGDRHAALLAQYPTKDAISTAEQDSVYQQIHHILVQNQAANMLKTPVYTIVFDSTAHQYVFGVTSAPKPYFRHPYRSFPKTIMEKHHEGAMIPMYKDEFGMWLSAFSVIKNRSGKVVALVQADEPFEAFIRHARAEALKNFLISLAVSGVFLFVLIRLLQPILKREEKDREALARAHEQIVALDHFRKEMMANVSHDLRTPIAAIMGFSDTLLQKKEMLTEAERERYLTIIGKETRRLNGMIGDLFDLSKLEAGQIILHKELFHFGEMAQDVLFTQTEQAKNRNIRLLTHFQEPLPLLYADIAWMDRVLQNLLSNAFKYVNDGGFIKFTLFAEADQLHLKVCNSGTPANPEHLPHLFERYFRSSNQQNDSTGLGLAIVKKIVELHGGKIWAELNEDLTTFRFSIPVILS
jgi:signal transduction histidine kinase